MAEPKPGTPKEKRRFVVRWRIDGRDFKRRRKLKTEAERYRSRLIAAAADGERFDHSTGEPTGWSRSELTWWDWSIVWLELKWPGWAGSSRKSGVEALVAFTPHLVRPRSPKPPPELRNWLWTIGFDPKTQTPSDAVLSWLERCSIPLDELDPATLEKALRLGTNKLDGSAGSATVARRRRDLLNAALESAVRRGMILNNPMRKVEWSIPKKAKEVDISVLPSMSDLDVLVSSIARLPTSGARYATFFAVIGYAGLRPSEVSALLLADIDLPSSGWGVAILRAGEPAPGRRYSNSGTVRQRKSLKHRPEGSTRRVPLPPQLVEQLRGHLDRWEVIDGRVFSNAGGRSVTATNYGKVWNREKPKAWGADHVAIGATAYDLRHTAATVMLRAGVPPAEVARRLGHSVDVLLKVYAGVFDDEEARSNKAISEELDGQSNASPVQ